MRKSQARLAVVMVAAYCSVYSGRSQAQNPRNAAAQALFEEGRLLLLANKLAAACPKLRESYHLEPALGTLLNLAVCSERSGKLASAYLEYQEAVALAVRARDEGRLKIAEERLVALEPLLSRLRISVPVDHRPECLVRLDGVAVPASALNTPLPIDPGQHQLHYVCPGKHHVLLAVAIAPQAGSVRVLLPVLRPQTSAPVTTADRGGVAHGVTGRRRVAWLSVAAGAGAGLAIAGFGWGTYFGLKATSEWSKRERHCEAGICGDVAARAGDEARRSATLSTLGFVMGVVGTGLAVTLVVIDSRRSVPVDVSLSTTTGADAHLGLRGMF